MTGSRIAREGYSSPTPLSVLSDVQLRASATSNVADQLTTLPAFSGSANTRSNAIAGSGATAGVNSLNLRSLGPSRTLVLLDGQRVVPALPAGTVDVNSLPQQLISHIDVVTGGASSVYGSDAVAGVVNFVLDKTYTGLKGEVSGGVTNYGDGQNYKLNLAYGTPLFGGRGHLLLAGEQVDDQGIDGPSGRTWNRRGIQTIANPAYTATNGLPQRLNLQQVGISNASDGGLIFSGPLRGTAFGQGGVPYTFRFGDIVADPYMRGGDWRSTDVRQYAAIAPKESRQNAFGRANFEIAPWFNLFGEASWTRTRNAAAITRQNLLGTAGPTIRVDNAFLPESVRQAMIANGLASVQIGSLNADLEPLFQRSRRTATRLVVGGDGKFELLGNDWRWDGYYQHGESKNLLTIDNNISRSRYLLATDAVRNPATGAIVCRSTLTNPTNGCSPWNPLGIGVNSLDSSGYAYINVASVQRLTYKQDVVAANVSGVIFDTAAGPVSVAAGFEHRKESSRTTVDATSTAADHQIGNYPAVNGGFDVSEGSIELLAPILKDRPFFYRLDLSAAARYTSYSQSGSVATWKIGATYQAVDDFTLRVTLSRDIRAPNIQELFTSPSVARVNVFDVQNSTNVVTNVVNVGNPDLSPEKAKTFGIGGVFRPSFVPGLSFSVDYWDININGAIASLSSNNVVASCFDGSRPELCADITRTAGALTQVIVRNRNLAKQNVRGLDFEASYRLPLEEVAGLPGTLTLHGNATRYLRNFQDFGFGVPTDIVGENGFSNPPTWRYSSTLAYQLNSFGASLTGRGFSSGSIYGTYIECTSACPPSTTANPTTNFNRMDGRLYLDLALNYDLRRSGHKITLFGNVRNLTNREPEAAPTTLYVANGANATLYDVDGRVYRAGLRFAF